MILLIFLAGIAPSPGHLVYPVVAQNPSFQKQHGKYQQTFPQFQPLYQGNTDYGVTIYIAFSTYKVTSY